MKLLLERGANPKIATDYGDTALSAAAGIGWVEGVTYEWSKEENYQAIKMLLDLGLDPNGANNDGELLMGAALKGEMMPFNFLWIAVRNWRRETKEAVTRTNWLPNLPGTPGRRWTTPKGWFAWAYSLRFFSRIRRSSFEN
jgi:hypothetical protein